MGVFDGDAGADALPPPLHHEFEILANSFEHWPNMCLIYPRSVCGLPEYFMKTSRKRHILLNNDEISFFFPRVTCPYLCCYKEIVSRYYVIPFVQIRQKWTKNYTRQVRVSVKKSTFLIQNGIFKTIYNIYEIFNDYCILKHNSSV